ncbi:COG3518 Predicted component of the type VI protein secretion system [Rhabdaerophilaceae bacterium]
MRDRTLFEQLDSAGRLSAVADSFSVAMVTESIVDNIRRIFNTRQGAVETRPDYGMPDLNDVVSLFLEAVPAIETAVRDQIEKFEPRLRNIDVAFEAHPDDPMALGFVVTATIVGRDGEQIRFDTRLGDDRRLSIRS